MGLNFEKVDFALAKKKNYLKLINELSLTKNIILNDSPQDFNAKSAENILFLK